MENVEGFKLSVSSPSNHLATTSAATATTVSKVNGNNDDDGVENDDDDVVDTSQLSNAKRVERWMQRIHPILARSLRRQGVGYIAQTSATVVGQSQSLDSAADSAAASRALSTASQHLDKILREGTVDDPMTVELYLRKLETFPESRIERELYGTYKPIAYHKAMTHVSALVSKNIYNPDKSSELIYFSGEDGKACSLSSQRIKSRDLLLVAVRGTVGLRDILVDLNSEPVGCRSLLTGDIKWHRGILRIAQDREDSVAAEIEKFRTKNQKLDGVLFTGHSLGGAIAEVWYASSFSQDTALFKVTQGLEEVHCITFGAPPITTIHISAQSVNSVFLSFVNEGDPVPQAQEDYIKLLLSVYALPGNEFTRIFGGLIIPKPVFNLIGDCIVLADKDQDDDTSEKYVALPVSSEAIATRLFGNPWMHGMDQYLTQLNALRDQ